VRCREYPPLSSVLLAIQVQKVEDIDRKLAPLAAKSTFQQSEKMWRAIGPRETQLGINYCGMGNG
jgi:hypothetical protein